MPSLQSSNREPAARTPEPRVVWKPIAVQQRQQSSEPMKYHVEENRTVVVSSSIPPGQWNSEAWREISQLSAASAPPENRSFPSQPYRRAHSEPDLEKGQTSLEETRRPVGKGLATSKHDHPHAKHPPLTRLIVPDRIQISSHSTSPRKLQKPPPPPERILFYHKNAPHYGFTNFSNHPVKYKGRVYPTSEHLFQSFKFQEHRPLLAEHIRTFSDRPSVAFSEARRFQPEAREDWMKVNISKMEETLWFKFHQHADLKQELLDTGNAELIEDSEKDAFWGVGVYGKGRNELGKALERLREKLREEH